MARDARYLSIAMVCDFFFPKIGGVESHIYMLAQTLIERGHKVIIVTHSHSPYRHSVRYLTRGIKVYHLPLRLLPPTSLHATLPNLFLSFPLLRQIFIRESVELVHAHAALSALGLEAILHARTMGLKAVFTDHSLMGFTGFGEIWGNKMLMACLSDVDAVICVSKAGRQNTCSRAALNPDEVHVIPSAVVASEFQPVGSTPFSADAEVVIVCMSRLVHRKGIDLLIGAIPAICSEFQNVRFIIGGDGPKMIELEQMQETHQTLLKGRIELLGSVRHEAVRTVLKRGHIFLNTALTEAFGIGILEAACAGLYVVSTRVGGVPEILPSRLIELADPAVPAIIDAVGKAIRHIKSDKHSPIDAHKTVKASYTWQEVSVKVEQVYHEARATPKSDIVERYIKYNRCGAVFGKIMCMVIALDLLLLRLMEYFWPILGIDLAPSFDQRKFNSMIEMQSEQS